MRGAFGCPGPLTAAILPPGLRYYNRLIDDLLACHVTPMVTLYHFDLPQALQDRGGWASPGMAGAFASYANFCFRTFGDRVKLWITINEPQVCAKLGHEDGLHAPGQSQPGLAAYLVGHNMLRAHAAAWRSYDALYRREQGGAVSLALNSDWVEPLRAGRSEDQAAARRCLAFTLGWFAWPVFVSGDYPEDMRSAVDARSQELGYHGGPRLPRFSEDEPPVLGTADFFALNYYTSRKVKAGGGGGGRMSMKGDLDVEEVLDPSWPVCGVPWLAVVPWGLRKLLRYIKVTSNVPTAASCACFVDMCPPLRLHRTRSGVQRSTSPRTASPRRVRSRRRTISAQSSTGTPSLRWPKVLNRCSGLAGSCL